MAAPLVDPHNAVLPPAPTADELRTSISHVVKGPDGAKYSLGGLRRQVAQSLGLDASGLDGRKAEFQELTAAVAEGMGAAMPRLQHVLLTCPEPEGAQPAQQHVYLVTFSRTLSQLQGDPHPVTDLATMTREGIAMAIKRAFDDPLPGGTRGGRPRAARPAGPESSSAINFVVTFQEKHADGISNAHMAP